jgi:hypothetical protein
MGIHSRERLNRGIATIDAYPADLNRGCHGTTRRSAGRDGLSGVRELVAGVEGDESGSKRPHSKGGASRATDHLPSTTWARAGEPGTSSRTQRKPS